MNNDTIISRISSLCNEKNISVNKMLSECGLNKSIVDNLKKGCDISAHKLAAIAAFFNCSVEYLMGADKSISKDTELEDYLQELRTRPEMRMLFNLAKGATKSDVEKAVEIIEKTIKK